MTVFRRMGDWSSPHPLAFGTLEPAQLAVTLAAVLVLVAIEALQEFGNLSDRWQRASFWLKAPVYAAAVLCVMNLGVFHETPFIYFQF